MNHHSILYQLLCQGIVVLDFLQLLQQLFQQEIIIACHLSDGSFINRVAKKLKNLAKPRIWEVLKKKTGKKIFTC